MDLSSLDLAVIWAFLIAFAIAAYVVLDGFDLGIGILFPWLEQDGKAVAMNSVAPVWDGNETWLILGGGGLFAAFPLAYAVVLPALYAPLMAMLLGLIFRGVAFEFRWRDPRHQGFWDLAFFGGSVVSALTQGIALGALLQGIRVEGRAYAGGWWDWLSPFSLLTGVAVLVGYALLGACWLNYKAEGELQVRARRYAARFGVLLLLAILAVSLATPFLQAAYWQRWFTWPNLVLTGPVPLLLGVAALFFFRTLKAGREGTPFLLALAMFFLSFVGLGVSIWPDVVPGALTIWQAAAPEKSQWFMLVGTLVILPVILLYTGYAYWVFRGKVGTDGYHEHD